MNSQHHAWALFKPACQFLCKCWRNILKLSFPNIKLPWKEKSNRASHNWPCLQSRVSCQQFKRSVWFMQGEVFIAVSWVATGQKWKKLTLSDPDLMDEFVRFAFTRLIWPINVLKINEKSWYDSFFWDAWIYTNTCKATSAKCKLENDSTLTHFNTGCKYCTCITFTLLAYNMFAF